MPLITVVIPVFNTEKYLEKCIKSILAQTEEDFELILVDDGSSDRSGLICDEYAYKDNRIRALHKTNSGVSDARNMGIEEAKGEYILFCDSDDYVEPDWIRRHLEIIREEPDAWVVSGVILEKEGREVGRPMPPEKKRYPKDAYFEIYKLYLTAFCHNKIYNLDLIRRKGLRFESGRKNAEDVQFNLAYLDCADSIYTIPEALYHYAVDTGVTGRYNAKRFDDEKWAFSIRLPYISDKYMAEFCSMYLSAFLTVLKLVFDERNPMTVREKYRYCSQAMQSHEFRRCLKYMDRNGYNRIFQACLRSGRYESLVFYDRLVRLLGLR